MATRRRWLIWVVVAAGAVVVLAVGGPFVYIISSRAPLPAPLSLKPGGQLSSPAATATSPAAGTPGSSSLAGTWRVGFGSVVGYRVGEVLLGQNNVAVGRSGSVTGHLEIHGTMVTAAEFSVPMASIHSDQGQRERRVRPPALVSSRR